MAGGLGRRGARGRARELVERVLELCELVERVVARALRGRRRVRGGQGSQLLRLAGGTGWGARRRVLGASWNSASTSELRQNKYEVRAGIVLRHQRFGQLSDSRLDIRAAAACEPARADSRPAPLDPPPPRSGLCPVRLLLLLLLLLLS